MPRVIVLDTLAAEGLQLLSQAPGITYEVKTGLKGDALRSALAEFDGAICRSGVKLTADALAGNRRLKAIVRAGVGVDNIDLKAATRLGMVVMNTPAGNTLSTAEHTIAMMLALSRNIAPAYQSLLEHRWDRNSYMGTQLANKSLGVVGLGRIGLAVASRARALEMDVVGYDPFLSAERAKELGIRLVASVAEMLPQVDYLTVHTPLTDETRNLISFKELEVLRPGVRLINCARGGIYDEQALLVGLQSKRIAGVALDVFVNEPCTDSPLFGQPGVLCTPHLGASTEEAQTNVAVEGCGLLVDFLTSGAIKHAVNMTPLDPQKLSGLRSFLNLSYRLGLLLAQLHKGPPQRCSLQFRGEVAAKDTKLLSAAFAAGLLEHALEEPINIVNSEMLLRERGIDLVAQSRADMGAFSSTITCEVSSGDETCRAAGTIFGQRMVRLVQLNEYRLEAYLDGVLLVFTHRDVPGIIGRVGTIFGAHQVNIAQMSVGRETDSPGGAAIGVLNLDSAPPPEAVQELLGHPDLLSARVVHLPKANEVPAWLAE